VSLCPPEKRGFGRSLPLKALNAESPASARMERSTLSFTVGEEMDRNAWSVSLSRGIYVCESSGRTRRFQPQGSDRRYLFPALRRASEI